MESTSTRTADPSRYSVDEIAGTLFIMKNGNVVAANVGEQGDVTESLRADFRFLCDAANKALDGPGFERK